MMNDLPSIFEVVAGTAKKQSKEKSSVSNNSSNRSKSNSKVTESANLFIMSKLCLICFLFQITARIRTEAQAHKA